MELSQIGPLVRAQRKACGLSQKDVARLAGLSRATINYLENDPDMDVGAAKLLVVLEILGIAVTAAPRPPDADMVLIDDALTSLQPSDDVIGVTREVLVEAIVTGRPPVDHRTPLAAFLTGAEAAAMVAAVRLATRSGEVEAKQAWKHLRSLASALEISGPVWAS